MKRPRHLGHDMVRIVLVGLVIGAVFAVPARAADPLPEFFGTYAIDGGKLIELNSDVEVDLGPQPRFVYFGQRISQVSDGPYMQRLLFVRYFDEETYEMEVGTEFMPRRTHIVKRVNQWTGGNAATQLRVKPVPGKPQMLMLVPSEPLAPGAYGINLHGVSVGALIYVNKSAVLRTRESDGFCFDRELSVGFGGGERLIPCRQSTLKEGTYCGPGAQDEGPCSQVNRKADVTAPIDAESAARSAAASTQSESKPSQAPEPSPGYKNCVSLGTPPESCVILYPPVMTSGAPRSASALSACLPAPGDDAEPWSWNSRILDSFPADVPRPVFAGAFTDTRHLYQLDLWRDSKGIFGEFRNPVLEADSPTSRLYDVRFDSASGALDFRVRFEDGDHLFSGTLRNESVTGTLRHGDRAEAVEWRMLPDVSPPNASNDSWSSRAQFDCAMNLFHRY